MLTALPDQFRTVDSHTHVWGNTGDLDREVATLLRGADRLGIGRLCISRPLLNGPAGPDDFRQANDITIEAMKRSERLLGFCFVNPCFPAAAAAEIDRCVLEHGMIGIKLYHQMRIDNDGQQPVMDKAAEFGIPVLMHAGKVTDPASRASQAQLSNAEHFLTALEKFPDTILWQAHIGGGGDWEWNLRALAGRITTDNYYIDLAGSVHDAGIIRRTIEAVGPDRVLFATDMSMEESVGKLLAAKLNETEMQKICSGNFERLTSRRKTDFS